MPNKGNQPSFTANTICRNSAATNDGSEYNMYKSVLTVRSVVVPDLTVDHKPNGIDSS